MLAKALARATLRLVAPSCLGEDPIAERLRARRIATADGRGRLERDRRVARESIASACAQGVADRSRPARRSVRASPAGGELRLGPGRKQVVFEVVAEERRVFVGQVVDGGLASL